MRLRSLVIRHGSGDRVAQSSADQLVCKQQTVLNSSSSLALRLSKRSRRYCTELVLRFEATPICCGALMVGICRAKAQSFTPKRFLEHLPTA